MRATGWLLDPSLAYLNHGGFGALPVEVAEAAAEQRARVEADPTGAYAGWLHDAIDDVRTAVASFVGARGDGTSLVPNATTGTATVLASFPWQPGDEVLTTDHCYAAVAIQLRALVEPRGGKVVTAQVPLDVTTVEDVVAAVMSATTDRTKLLVVDHVASATGFVFPVREIVAAAHERGIAVLIDGAHAPGQLELDVDAIGADAYVGNLHKWVCSPRSAAFMSVAPRWRDVVRPLVPSHLWGTGPLEFTVTGTHDVVPVLAVPAALAYWDNLGWDGVRREQRSLAADGAAVIAAALGTHVPVHDEFSAALRIAALPQPLTAEAAREAERRLRDDHGVVAVVTDHGGWGWLRVCGQVYNEPADYDRAAGALVHVLAELTG